MKNWKIAALNLVLLFIASANVYCQSITIGERFQLDSEVLRESREYLVHLPGSYYHSEKTNYPVVYLLDGEYNFNYVAGLLDQMSSISGQIPEMILVGISDKGTNRYRDNMTSEMEDDLFNEKSGNANSFMLFLENELKVAVSEKFRTLPYEILIGHSMGGLFTINCLLRKPDFFDAYLAISPSLWVNDNIIENKADSLLNIDPALNKFAYITLADEHRMGVYSFIDILENTAPEGLDWHFKKYENENHNSVGLVSIRDGLLSLFEYYEIERTKLSSFDSFAEISEIYQAYSLNLGGEITFPEIVIGNLIGTYTSDGKQDQIDLMESELIEHFPASLVSFYNIKALYALAAGEGQVAKDIYSNQLKENPNSYKLHQGLAKVQAAMGEATEAKETMDKAIELASKQKTAQWMMNILIAERVDMK